jgi:hypothetical protein
MAQLPINPINYNIINGSSSTSILNIVNNFDLWCFMENDPDERKKRQKFVICLLDTEHDHYDKAKDKPMWKSWIAYYINKRDKLIPIKTDNTSIPTNLNTTKTQLFNNISTISLTGLLTGKAAPKILLTNHNWLTTCCANATEIGFELFTRWIKRRDKAVGDKLIGYCQHGFTLPSGANVPATALSPTNRVSSMVYAKKAEQEQLNSIIWSPVNSAQLYYLYDQGAPNFTNIGKVSGTSSWKLAIGLGGNYDKSGKKGSGTQFNNTSASKVFFNGTDFEGILGYDNFELNNGVTTKVTPRWEGYLLLPGNTKYILISSLISDPNKDKIKSAVQQFVSGAITKVTGIYQYLSNINGGKSILNVLSTSKNFSEINEKGISPTTDIKRLGDWSQSFEVKSNDDYLFATGDYLAAGIACYFNEVTTLLKIPKLLNGSTVKSTSGNLIMFNSSMAQKPNPFSCKTGTKGTIGIEQLFVEYSNFRNARKQAQLGGKRTKKNLKLKGGVGVDVEMKKDEELFANVEMADEIEKHDDADIKIDDIYVFVKLILNPEKYNISQQSKTELELINKEIKNKLLSIMVGTLYLHLKNRKEINLKNRKEINKDEEILHENSQKNFDVISEDLYKKELSGNASFYVVDLEVSDENEKSSFTVLPETLLIDGIYFDFIKEYDDYMEDRSNNIIYWLQSKVDKFKLTRLEDFFHEDDRSLDTLSYNEYLSYITNIHALSSDFKSSFVVNESGEDLLEDPINYEDLVDDDGDITQFIKNEHFYNAFYNLTCFNILEHFTELIVEGIEEYKELIVKVSTESESESESYEQNHKIDIHALLNIKYYRYMPTILTIYSPYMTNILNIIIDEITEEIKIKTEEKTKKTEEIKIKTDQDEIMKLTELDSELIELDSELIELISKISNLKKYLQISKDFDTLMVSVKAHSQAQAQDPSVASSFSNMHLQHQQEKSRLQRKRRGYGKENIYNNEQDVVKKRDVVKSFLNFDLKRRKRTNQASSVSINLEKLGGNMKILKREDLKPTPKPAVPKQATHKPTPKQPTPKQSTPKQPTPKQSTPKQPTPKQSTPKQSAPKQPSPKPVVPKQATPKPAVPKQPTPKPKKALIVLDKQYRIKELKEVAKNNNIKLSKKVDGKYVALNKKELITTLNKRKLI